MFRIFKIFLNLFSDFLIFLYFKKNHIFFNFKNNFQNLKNVF